MTWNTLHSIFLFKRIIELKHLEKVTQKITEKADKNPEILPLGQGVWSGASFPLAYGEEKGNWADFTEAIVNNTIF